MEHFFFFLFGPKKTKKNKKKKRENPPADTTYCVATMLSPVLCSDAALKKNSFSGWPSAFSSLCAHSKCTLGFDQGCETN